MCVDVSFSSSGKYILVALRRGGVRVYAINYTPPHTDTPPAYNLIPCGHIDGVVEPRECILSVLFVKDWVFVLTPLNPLTNNVDGTDSLFSVQANVSIFILYECTNLHVYPQKNHM